MREVDNTLIPCGCNCGQLRTATDPQGRPVKYIRGHDRIIKIRRECYACGTIKSRNLKTGYNNWCVNKGTSYFLCRVCVESILYRGRVDNYKKKRLLFKGKRTYLSKQIRTGKCSKCGKEGRTNIHHEKYDDNDPTAYTIELCVRCHTLRSVELGQIDLNDRLYKMRAANPRLMHLVSPQEVPKK